jgi:hypothetical protein
MRDQLRLWTTSFPKFTKRPSPVASKRASRTLPSSQRRSPHTKIPRGTHPSIRDNGVHPPNEILKSLISNLVFPLTTGICSWQLMKRHSKLRPAVWVLGTVEKGFDGRSKKMRQKLEAQIEKMRQCSAKKTCRIRGICLRERMRKGDPVAMASYGARYAKYK